MKKADVKRSYHQGSGGDPMINVKHHLWVPDLVRRWRDDGHEFSGDAEFWDWLACAWNDDFDYPLEHANELAQTACWEFAADYAHEVWPDYSTELVDEKRWSAEHQSMRFTGEKVPRKRYHVQVYAAGRSGGWLVVSGLPDVEAWDAIDLARWRRFERLIRDLADSEYPYEFIWHLHENVWEPNYAEPRRAAARRAEEAERWVDALATLG